MSLSSKYPTVKLLGINVFALRMNEVLDIADECIANGNKLLVGILNVAKIVNIRKDPLLRTSLDESDIILADGVPIVWLSRMLGTTLPERIAGIDLMYRLLERASEKNYSVYFLGAKPEVVEKVVEFIKNSYPGLRVAGYRDGYFKQSEERKVAEDINESCADILFVAISSPKKETFLGKWRSSLNVPICHGVGGSFDIIAGVTKRAPLWMQKFGLEWLYRLIQEPRRMWKRYLVTNTIFMKLSLQAILKAKLNKLFGKSTYLTVSDAKNRNE
jgi:N-acetylglucosaminyldiphosphoundecaprenol N-acetyl-beta-D-mannosaminyltransferase